MGYDGFKIEDDGTVTRTMSDLDSMLLNITRASAAKSNVLAAYRARKKCYKICKKKSHGRDDYKEYVDCLQLDHFPAEFKKAELGKQYRNWLYLFAIPLIGLLLSPMIINKCNELAKEIKKI